MINLGCFAAGATIEGEVNFIDFSGVPNTISGASFSLYAWGNASAIGAVSVTRIGATNRYKLTVTDSSGAGTYIISGTCTINNGGTPVDLVIAQFVIGNIPCDLQTIKTQTVTCPGAVTVAAFVGTATHALVVDSNGYATFNNTSIATVTTVTTTTTVTNPVSLPSTPPAGYGGTLSGAQIAAIATQVSTDFLATTADGLPLSKVFQVLMAAAINKTARPTANTIQFFARDGVTVVATLTFNPSIPGLITGSVVV